MKQTELEFKLNSSISHYLPHRLLFQTYSTWHFQVVNHPGSAFQHDIVVSWFEITEHNYMYLCTVEWKNYKTIWKHFGLTCFTNNL